MVWVIPWVICCDGDSSRPGAPPPTSCSLVFDAGSSGTRVQVYKHAEGRYQELAGDKSSIAVSYPAEGRDCAGGSGTPCTNAEVVQAVTTLANEVKDQCPQYDFVGLFATAGMRLAEQRNPRGAEETWKQLGAQLRAAFPPPTRVRAYTLSGYEEGLYTWLSVNALAKEEYGILEVGGASVQVAYGCEGCEGAREVKLASGETRSVYAYSFLGLGVNEAHALLAAGGICTPGTDTSLENCSSAVASMVAPAGILDPYNYTPRGGEQGQHVPMQLPKTMTFWGASTLAGYDANQLVPDAKEICPLSDQALAAADVHKPYRACFLPLYLIELLDALHLPTERLISNRRQIDGTNVGWPLGALICDASDCLGGQDGVCRWMKDHRCLR